MKRILSKQLALVLIIVMLLPSVGISEEEVNVLIKGSKVEAETIETQFEEDDIVSSIVDEPVIEESNDVDLPIEDDYIERLDNTQDGSVDGSEESNSDTDLGSKESDSDVDLGSVESDSDANLGSESITTDPAREIDGDQAEETGPKETKNEETEEQGSEGGSAIASIEGEDSVDEQSGETEPNENMIISSDEEYFIVSEATDEEVSEYEFSFDGIYSEENPGNLDYTDTAFAAEAAKLSNTIFYAPLDNFDPNVYSSGFGPRNVTAGSSWHAAIDYGRNRGTPIYPIYRGKVVGKGYYEGSANAYSSGHYITIRHDLLNRTIYSHYQHMNAASSYNIGDDVTPEKAIGYVGNSGDGGTGNMGCHLDIRIFEGGAEPWKLLNSSQVVSITGSYGTVVESAKTTSGITYYNPAKVLDGTIQFTDSNSASVPSTDTSPISKTYRVKSTTTLGLNIRPAATTANTPLGTLSPGVTIACTKRTNNQINGYYWLYGTTSTGITGWITENLDWIEEVSSSTTSSTSTSTSSTSTSTSSQDIITIKAKSMRRKAKWSVGTKHQYDFGSYTIKSCKSSKKKVATISSTGIIETKAEGKTKITVRFTNNKIFTLQLTVIDRTKPKKITLNKKGIIKWYMQDPLTLTATLSPKTAVSDITWKTSNSSIATVNNGVLTFKKKGFVKITATTNKGKKKASVIIWVVSR